VVEPDNADVDNRRLPDSHRPCPKCAAILKLARVAASPSPLYQAHSFTCPACTFSFVARVDV
jgi:hypothetical protein